MTDKLSKCVKRVLHRILWGGQLREKCLIYLLSRHYRSIFRRIWHLSDNKQCFENQSGEWFSLGFDEVPNSVPKYFARGFFASEVIQPGDTVLDIGCGDGFFSKRFYAASGAQVDGIDIESVALVLASRCNSAPDIKYFCLDPLKSPLPRSHYNVIVWDGAIGHFRPDTTDKMLSKISEHLAEGGIFIGSESLGRDDHGHLTYFDSVDDLRSLFSKHFAYMRLKEWKYPINSGQGTRTEAYWRCAKSESALDLLDWHS